ncbi:SUMF1/EgtB/PvdO family nonheme iron enzyme [Nocardia abscessus]|uniref:SUMF1/EgtB/PvdO family nonheme iron enzyme n=1 Tax=Nocardia abscessus TaxID=120957 RepID=UPI001893F0F7|nr:SUMF1/EgtB/PvdO family nonheme iron enzyme [Nocardia abscessus]MBF6339926.1 SUMF1/EgtB/PvdO family nonheme iron enzyme [Nocardia abscessus]
MADLEWHLWREVRSWLAPHLIEEDQRLALSHLLIRWPGHTKLRRNTDAQTFTNDLLRLLSNELLVEVLRTVAEGLGVEQRRTAEDLCARIEEADAAGSSGRLPPLGSKRVPAQLQNIGESVLFHPADTAADPDATLSVEAIGAEWRDPLVLITDFPADAEQSLVALAQVGGPVIWVAGEDLVGASSSAPSNGSGHRDLAATPPGLLLVDFSGIHPESAWAEDGSGAEALSMALAWAEAKGHRVALALPRHVEPGLGLDSPHHRPWRVYRAVKLYSHRYAHRAEHCERLYRAPLPLRDVLFPLLSANSACLAAHVAGILTKETPRRSRTESDEIALAMSLARGLTALGFYEIAYRLEVHCRTRSVRAGLIPLAVDLLPTPGSPEKGRVVGFVASASDLPSRVQRATLTGPTGAGKSITLRDIENRWSVPGAGQLDEWIVPYVPVYVSLSGADAPRRRIDDHLADVGFRSFVHGDTWFELVCHSMVSRLGSLDGMRRLFSSPVLLLLDDADELSPDAERELELNAPSESDTALLLASRVNRGGPALRLREARIRELDEQQVSLLLQKRGGHRSLSDLLGPHGRGIAYHIRNPRLLTVLCELELTVDDLAEADLATILERFVTRRSTESGFARAAGEDPDLLTQWLADVAYEFLTIPQRARRAAKSERGLVAEARSIGLLRERTDRDLIEFEFETLGAYFAARRLAAEVGRHGVNAVMEPHVRRIVADSSGQWQDVCRILVALLRTQDTRKFIELLARNDLRLAHECAAELSGERRRIGSETAALLMRRMTAERDTDDRIDDARALGRHDPRIDADKPRDGMVEVPASTLQGSYRIGRYPVTALEFARFVMADGYRNEDWWSPAGWRWKQRHGIAFPRYWHNRAIGGPNYPVTGVNFFEASAYCSWLTHNHRDRDLVFRLPSTLEWDRAAYSDDRVLQLVLDITAGALAPRAEHGQPPGQQFGRQFAAAMLTAADDMVIANLLRADMDRVRQAKTLIEEYLAPHQEQLRFEAPTPVGIFTANKLGIHDLFGGVWEWCNTAVRQISQSAQQYDDIPHNTTVAEGVTVGIKGGGNPSGSYNPIWLLIGGWFDPLVRSHRLGFRVTCRPGSSSGLVAE